MAERKESQSKSAKDRERILERKYKNYGIDRNGGSSSTQQQSGYEVYNGGRVEKMVVFDENEKNRYVQLTPEKQPEKGGFLSRFMKRLSLDKTKQEMAKDDDDDEVDLGYVQDWEEDKADDDGEEEEEEGEAGGEGGASTAIAANHLAHNFKGMDFGKDDLTKEK